MIKVLKLVLVPAISLAGAANVAPAHAGFSWTIDSNPVQGSCEAAAVGNTCQQFDTDAGTTVTMTASGWASSLEDNTGSTLEQATLRRWDGLAVSAQGEDPNAPEHATDNNGKLESVLYSFNSGGSAIDVIINSVTQGWHEDADFSLLAYTPSAGDPTAPDFSGLGYDDLTNNGWQLVSNNTYHEPASGTNTDITASDDTSTNDYQTSNLNSGAVASSYWLVAVLNGAFWNDANYIGNDYIKIKTLTASLSLPSQGQGGGVPEPSTLALLAVALGALAMARRRRLEILPLAG